jgi:hypothetical protein
VFLPNRFLIIDPTNPEVTKSMIPVFIGYDPVERVAFNVLSNSIQLRASQPVSITPIMLSQINDILTRKRDPLQSTEFSFSCFLVPYLCDYRGWAIFMDCDMLAQDDIGKLWALRDDRYAVQVVKHTHVPAETTKFLGNTQTRYQKKNWSSVMMFNNAKCTALTVHYVNTASGLDLHQFKWLNDDSLIGEIPSRWNHLVGYDKPRVDPGIVHFTIGGPYFDEYKDCEHSAEWFAERESMLHCRQRNQQSPN